MAMATPSCRVRMYLKSGWSGRTSIRGSSVVPGLPMIYSTPAARRISKKACGPAMRGICVSPYTAGCLDLNEVWSPIHEELSYGPETHACTGRVPHLWSRCLGDFQERFSPGSCPAFAWVDLPPAGGGQVGGGEVAAHAVPPSNLPPLGGGNGHEGHSF